MHHGPRQVFPNAWQSSIPQIIHGRPTSEQPFIDEGIQPFLLIRRNILVPSFTDTVTPIITCSQHHAAMQVCKWRCTHMFSCRGTYPMWHPRVAPTLQILRSDYYSCFHIGEPYFTFSPYSLYLLFSCAGQTTGSSFYDTIRAEYPHNQGTRFTQRWGPRLSHVFLIHWGYTEL